MFNDNIANISDEELYRRIDQANRKINAAASVGANSQIISQMQAIINAYQFELSDRAQRLAFETNRKHLEATIETDPAMNEQPEDEKVELKQRKRVSF